LTFALLLAHIRVRIDADCSPLLAMPNSSILTLLSCG